MKVLSLKIHGKTYTTSRITAYLSRKAMEIHTKSIELAKAGTALKESGDTDLDAIQELMEKMAELNDQKSWFICQVYGEKFGIEDLEKDLTNEEIESEIQRITNAINGVIEKNA